MPDALDQVAATRGHCEYLRFPHLDVSLSYEDVRAASERLARWFVRQGIERGERVALMLDNTPDWPITWFAVLRSGGCVVPVNARYRHADIAHVLKDSGASLILTSADKIQLVQEAAAQSGSSCRVVDIQLASDESAELDASSIDLPNNVNRNDIANLQYTSGTTGFPKACVLTHDYWIRAGATIGAAIGMNGDDVAIMSQAWSYVDPPWMTVMCTLAGATHVVLERFSASGFWRDARANGATVTYVLGAMPVLLAKQPPQPEDTDNALRVVLCSAIPKDRHRELEDRWEVPWREAYGSTETGVDLIASPDAVETVGTGALGLPPRGKQVLVVNENGDEQPAGVPGEIVVSGRPMMLGYWNREEETAKVLSNGRYRTGDLGVVDADGYIRHAGRIKDMIRRGGENIAAGEVEAILNTHPAVLSAAVVGIADDLYEEIPKAYVVLAPHCQPTEETARGILEFARSQLAAFKVPTILEFRESFPMTPSQRVEKRKLLESTADHRSGRYTFTG